MYPGSYILLISRDFTFYNHFYADKINRANAHIAQVIKMLQA